MSKLKEYLDAREETIHEFSVRSKLSFPTVLTAYNGGAVRERTAKKIVKACKKKLTLSDLRISYRDDHINDCREPGILERA